MSGLPSRARALARLSVFVAATAAAFIAQLAIGRLVGRSRITRLWAKATARIIGLELRVAGPPPAPPFLLVANHLGYVDVIVLGALVDAVFVAKSEVARWPLMGRAARSAGTVFVDRTSARGVPAALARIEEALSAGHGIVLFPEGTSSDGEGVLPFRPSLLAAAERAGLAVHWAALRYDTGRDDPPAGSVVCWWGDMPFLGHLLELLALPRITAHVAFGDAPLAATDRKRLACELHGAVTRLRAELAGPCAPRLPGAEAAR